MGEIPQEINQVSKKSEKKKTTSSNKPFSIRLNSDLKTRLETLAREQNVTETKMAKNYIQLSKYFVARTNYSLQMIGDRSESFIFPQSTVRSLIKEIQNTGTLSNFGDELGKKLLANANMLSVSDKKEILNLAVQLNWLHTTEIDFSDIEAGKRGVGILSSDWPIEVIYGMLYRIFHNDRFPVERITEARIRKFLNREPSKKEARDEKEAIQAANEFKEKLGGMLNNYDNNEMYYKFKILLI